MISKDSVINFLRSPKIQEALQENDLTTVYEEFPYKNVSDLTEFFIDIDINPLEYLTEVQPYMYLGLDMSKIYIPDDVTRIWTAAFRNCYELEYIRIPSSVDFITPDNFVHCPKLTIYCSEGSYAHQFAIDSNIRFNLI